METPKRKYSLELSVGGDTREDLLRELNRFVQMIEEGSDGCVSGGYNTGGHFTLTERKDLTHEVFAKELAQWFDEQL